MLYIYNIYKQREQLDDYCLSNILAGLVLIYKQTSRVSIFKFPKRHSATRIEKKRLE